MFKVTTNDKSLDYDDVRKLRGFKAAKRPVMVSCFEISERMTFHTDTGIQEGMPGMICIIGVDHAWPVTKKYFDENYLVMGLI